MTTVRTRDCSFIIKLLAGCSAIMLLHGCGLFLSEEAQLKRAQTAEQHGDFRAASIDLKSLLEKHPENIVARFHLGTVDLALGDSTNAIRELERVQKESVVAGDVVEPLARAYLGSSQSDKALQLLDTTIASEKNNTARTADKTAALLRLRGEALAAQHHLPEAQQAFKDALEIAPNDIASLLDLATVVSSIDGAKAALAITERAIAAAPNDAKVHRVRGALLLEDGQPAEAIEEFKQATAAPADKHKGDWLMGMAGLAQAQLALNRIPDALATTAQMQQAAAASPLSRYMRAYALVQNGDLDQARPLLEQNDATGSDMRSRVLLGAVNLAQGRFNQAEMYLSSVVAAMPDNAAARQLLAETRMRQAKPTDALDALAPALEAQDANASLLALAGRASLAAGDTQKGMGYLRRNAQQHPDSTTAKLDLAAGYLSAGQPDQALEILDEKKNASPADNEVQTEAQQVNRDYLSVLARLKKGDNAGANAYAIKLVQEKPDRASLQSLAGSLFAMQGLYAQARPYFEAAARLRPDDGGSYLALGRLDLAQGHPDQAKAQFSKALEKQPANATAAIALAMLEVAANHPDVAAKLLKDSLQKNPNNIDIRVIQAQLLLQRGDLDNAEKVAREAVALTDSNGSVLATLGRVLSVAGKHAEAIEMFNRAVHAAPKSAPVRYQAAVAQRVAGHLDQAIIVAQQALDIDPRYVQALQFAGTTALAKRDVPTATKYIDALAKAAPEQSTTHAVVGELRLAQQRYEDASAEFRKAGELQPISDYVVREYQARKLGKLSTPIASLQKFLIAHPDDQAVLIVLAQEQLQLGDRKSAMKSYEQVIAKNAKNAVALNNLAWMHYEDGQPDALELSRRAYEAAPTAIEIADTHAWLLTNAGQASAAVKLLEKIPGINQASMTGSKIPAEIVAHYAVALNRSGRNSEAQSLARDVAQNQMQQITAPMQKLITELAKT